MFLKLLPSRAGGQRGHEQQPRQALVAQFRKLHRRHAVHRDAEEPHTDHACIEDYQHPQAIDQPSRPNQPVAGIQRQSQEQGARSRPQEIDRFRGPGCADAESGNVLKGLEDVQVSQKSEDEQSVERDYPCEPQSGSLHVSPLPLNECRIPPHPNPLPRWEEGTIFNLLSP